MRMKPQRFFKLGTLAAIIFALVGSSIQIVSAQAASAALSTQSAPLIMISTASTPFLSNTTVLQIAALIIIVLLVLAFTAHDVWENRS